MYLKRLDVQGFKSFANRTTLEFAPGVTCVVGPNGTGKTNVADSLRWVLGEHASRTLRARKTEDVIFAGSDKRAQMGVAEVSITLDNSTQWLPIEFADVVVTRRAYRSGDNEYLINNTKVRLRDVVDLFMRAQVGQNSYAFMGQGMVEQVLSLRPEDRRGLIEEAADVRLYRIKLEDSQNKLKATRENLDRVRLLVREIEPRITQLERQAGRAVKYQELARELAVTLHAWYGHQWGDINAQVLAAITTQDQRTEELEHARAAVRTREDGLVQLRAAIEERRREIALRETRLRNLQDYARDLERRAALDAERAKMLGERIEELTAELTTLQADEAAQEEATPATDTSEQEATLMAARGELATQRERLASVETDLHELQRGALASEQASSRARAQADDLSRRMADAADAIARLRREQELAADEERKLASALAESEQENTRLEAEVTSVGSKIEQALNDRRRAVDGLALARRETSTADAEMRALRSEFEAAQVRLELMETIDVRPQAPDAGVRAILEAGNVIKRDTVAADVSLPGVLGLVGQLMRVPPGLEKAIEAALADSLFAIVVERDGDMLEALDFLIRGDSGRATIYALDNFQEQRPLNLMKEKGVVGVASALVKCDSRYRKLIDTLLGRTVVVEDLGLAHRFVRRGLANAVATTDGMLLRPVGSVSAGSLTMVEAAFAHEREMDDLPAEIERLRPLIAEREMYVATAGDRIAAAERRIADTDATLEELRALRAKTDTLLANAHAGLGALRARLQTSSQVATRRGEEIVRQTDARQAKETERDARIRDALAAEEKEQEQRRAIAELDTARMQLADAIGEHAATVAHLDGELRTERQVTGVDRAARERLSRQLTTKDEQRNKAQDEGRGIASRLDLTRRELAGKNEEIEALQLELEPARSELAQFESRERSLSTEVVEANARQREGERALMEAENDARTRRDELDALRQSLESEGFVATEDGEIERLSTDVPEEDAARADHDGDGSEAYGDAPGDLPRWMRTPDGNGGGGGDLPPIRGASTINPTELRDKISDLRAQIRGLGPVNEQAATDYSESRERFDFLTGQLTDMAQAEAQLNEATSELETIIRDRFRSTFKIVNREFERYFSAFFQGGTARLELGETDEQGLPGVEIIAQPPGKKLGSLALLSGGERSLTAVALLFALLQANPSPICVLDEVDAALDEANVGRFVEELRQLAQKTQFIIITHNRRTIETADTIYGVSMGADNVSRVLSLKLGDIEHDE